MLRPADIPEGPGVFVMLHAKTKHAYVNEARNLKERASIWSALLNNHDRTGSRIRVRDWPHDVAATADEWEFRCSTDPDVTVTSMHAYLVRAGWSVVRARSRHKTTYYVVDGIKASLVEHCRRLGIENWSAVYKRVERGMSPAEALGLDPKR